MALVARSLKPAPAPRSRPIPHSVLAPRPACPPFGRCAPDPRTRPDRVATDPAAAHLSDLHLSDLHAALEATAPSSNIMPLQRERLDFDPAQRDLQSDLFLLDQAMQNPPSGPSAPPPADPLLALSGGSALGLPEESGLGDAPGMFTSAGLNTPAPPLCHGLFDDIVGHSKLLGYEGPPTDGSPPVADSARPTSDQAAPAAPADLECILQELGIGMPNAGQARTEPGLRPLPLNPHFYGAMHEAPHLAFGRARKRRAGGPADGPLGKRARSDMGPRFARAPLPSPDARLQTPAAVADCGGFARAEAQLRDLGPSLQRAIGALRAKIETMPRRKLRESLARGVTIDEVIPLMSVNRDDLAGMLGLGVTTWKIFIHHTFGIPRWPARVLKSQEMRERSLQGRLREAEARGDAQACADLWGELRVLQEKRKKGRNQIRAVAKKFREKSAGGPVRAAGVGISK